MIRTLDASDFIEIKEKGPASPDFSLSVIDVSLTKTDTKAISKTEKGDKSDKSEIRLFLSKLTIFANIGPQEISRIADNADLIIYNKDKEIAMSGQSNGDKFYIIKKGHVKIIKTNKRGSKITTGYLQEGDFFGEAPLIYNAENSETTAALTDIELIALDKDSFRELCGKHHAFKQAIINKSKTRAKELSEIENNPKASGMMSFMVENGITYATRLKVYELNKCINCFSCVKVCKERHGVARFRKAGQKYSYVSIPQSCRTCKYPTCISKCRKGAIRREDDGEIAINSKCVGCGLCAKSCAFGAIEIIELEPGNEKTKRKAIKCEHCRGYKDCACVSECPTGAIKHVDPKTYFNHLLTQQEVK